MAEVARDEFEVVMDGRCSDLEVGVRKEVACALQVGADLPEDSCNREVVRKDGYRREDAVLDVSEMPFLCGRAVRTFE